MGCVHATPSNQGTLVIHLTVGSLEIFKIACMRTSVMLPKGLPLTGLTTEVRSELDNGVPST